MDKRSHKRWIRAGSCAATIRWRGWRPPFLDGEVDECRTGMTFLLAREGDLLLLPAEQCGGFNTPGRSLQGVESGPLFQTLAELLSEGWQVLGRLHTGFVGREVEDDFWRETCLRLGVNLPPRWRPYLDE